MLVTSLSQLGVRLGTPSGVFPDGEHTFGGGASSEAASRAPGGARLRVCTVAGYGESDDDP